jgi:biopolymer transport protein ExbD
MRAHDSEQEDHFNLLPFIAILLCVLGTELLVTMSTATISLGVGLGEGWVPNPDKFSKKPILLEWDGQVVTVQRKSGDETIPVNVQEKSLPPALKILIDELAVKHETDYALFAVRPSGFENYFRLAEKFKDRGIDVGDEPVEQGKRIRLMEDLK